MLMFLSLLLSLPRDLPGVSWLQGSGQGLKCRTVQGWVFSAMGNRGRDSPLQQDLGLHRPLGRQ